MSKKKHPEHVNHERWLVSYADFITLLFAFFVVLFASGQSDKHKQAKLALAMQTAFEHNGIFDPHAKTPPISDEPSSASSGAPSPLALPLPTAADAAKGTEARIRGMIEKQVSARTAGAAAVSLRPSPDGLVVSLREAGFFDSGSAQLRPGSVELLRALAAALPRQAMRVEGHTDNLPIATAQFASNWELSTARAAAITRLLIAEKAVDAAKISAAGYAEFRPIADNDSEAGRMQNRRVDIVLLASSPAPAPPATKPQVPAASR